MASDDTSHLSSSPFVLAAVDDLFFLIQVKDAAKRTGFGLKNGQTPGAILDLAAKTPALIVVDLHSQKLDPLQTIRQLKSPDSPAAKVPLLAYLSHVQVELGQAAREAGADIVVPRSAFLRTLNETLARLL